MNHDQDTKRFYDLVWPLRADVLRLAQFMTHRPADADDVAQETLLKAFRKIDSFKEGSDAKAWLLTILRNTWRDRVRAARSHPQASREDPPAEQTIPEARQSEWTTPWEILNGFSDQQVIDALKKLPEEMSWTLLLVDVEGLGQEEAGQILEIPVGTVKSRIHRGHALLRNLLSPMARERRLVRE